MPELPEVETAKRYLSEVKNFVVKNVKIQRKDGKAIRLKKPIPDKEFANLLGKKLTDVKRRSKYLFLEFEDYYLVCHFGMTGMLYYNRSSEKHEVIRILGTSKDYFSYCDIRKFGLLDIVKKSEIPQYLKKLNLGFEPLGKKIDKEKLKSFLESSNKPIKDWLLDQSKITGIGNIYASEICFACSIHPKTPAKFCANKSNKILKETIRILTKAIEAGGSTINNYDSPNGKKGNAQLNHKVYNREGLKCFNCDSVIKRISQSGRSTFYCEHCQTQ